MTPPINAVIFDIGQVLIEWDPRFLYEKLVADREKLEHLLANIVTLEWHTAHDAGLPMVEGVRRLSAQFPDHADLIDLFRIRWFETLGPVIDGSITALKALYDAKMPLYALTNFSAETFPEFARRYPFMGYFKDVLVSGEVGMVKPDPRIFELAATRFQVDPARTLFIDDREANISAAKAQGFQTHLFTDAAKLQTGLKDRGLL